MARQLTVLWILIYIFLPKSFVCVTIMVLLVYCYNKIILDRNQSTQLLMAIKMYCESSLEKLVEYLTGAQ